VGVEIIGNLVQQDVIVHNRVHHNIYDGISHDNRQFNAVTVAGANVSCTDCGSTAPNFSPGWAPGSVFTVNGEDCTLLSVDSATTLKWTAPCGSSGTLWSSTDVSATITENTSWNNGNQAVGGTGIFNFYSNGNIYRGNTAWRNYLEGFGAFKSNFLNYSRNTAIGNNISGGGSSNAGFLCNSCLNAIYSENSAHDPARKPMQVVGLLCSGSLNTSIAGSGFDKSSVPLKDNCTRTTYKHGSR
jgi:hypothetical protein